MKLFKLACTFKLFVLLSLISNWSHAQSYGCRFLDIMMAEMQTKGKQYEVYSAVMNNKLKAVKGNLADKERISMSDKVMDSLVKCCNHTGFFDDSLFHMKGKVLVIDTFNFFSTSCNSKYAITVINSNSEASSIIKNYKNVVILQSIKVYKNSFIIKLKHYKSDEAVEFSFELAANYPPQLTEVERWYLE